jgi:hypothetical protein
MNNTSLKLPTMEEVKQALKEADKYMIFADENNVPQAIYEIKRPTKLLTLRDDTWDNNNQY